MNNALKKRILVLLKSKEWKYVGTSYNRTSISLRTDECDFIVTINDIRYTPSVRVVKVMHDTGKTYECFHVSFSILFSSLSRELFLKAYRKVEKVRKQNDACRQQELALAMKPAYHTN